MGNFPRSRSQDQHKRSRMFNLQDVISDIYINTLCHSSCVPQVMYVAKQSAISDIYENKYIIVKLAGLVHCIKRSIPRCQWKSIKAYIQTQAVGLRALLIYETVYGHQFVLSLRMSRCIVNIQLQAQLMMVLCSTLTPLTDDVTQHQS